MTDNDAQLELKKRARRRLVGAIALAVLGPSNPCASLTT